MAQQWFNTAAFGRLAGNNTWTGLNTWTAAGTFTGGLSSTMPAVTNFTFTDSLVIGETPSFTVVSTANVLDGLVSIGAGNTFENLSKILSADDNYWLSIGFDNAFKASSGSDGILIGRGNTVYGTIFNVVGTGNSLGTSGAAKLASNSLIYSDYNVLAGGAGGTILGGSGNTFGVNALGNLLINCYSETVNAQNLTLLNTSGGTYNHNGCTVIGGGGLASPATTQQNEFILGSTNSRYRFAGYFPDGEYLYFGATATLFSRIYRDAGTTNLVIEPDGGSATGRLSISGNYALPNIDGTVGQVLTTDGSGTVNWSSPGVAATPGGSNTQFQYNNAGAFGGTSNFTWDGANATLAGGYFQFNSSIAARFGTGNLGTIQHNGTNFLIGATTGNLILTPASGSEITLSGATKIADNGNIGLDNTTPAANQFIKCDSSGGARGCLNFKYNFTSGTVATNVISDVTMSTSVTTPKSYMGELTQAVNNASPVTGTVYDAEMGFSNTTTFSSGTYSFHCFRAQHANGTGTVSNSGGTFNLYGLRIDGFSNMKGSSTTNRWGIDTAEPIQIRDDVRLYFGGALGTFGTAVMAWNTTTTALELSVPNNGFKVTQTTAGNAVQTLTTTATNDDPVEKTQQNRVATTDATVTTLDTYTIPASTTVVIATTVTARRTGGSAGTAEDGAGYGFSTTVKNVAGTATIIAGPTAIWTHESQAGWDATHDVTGATVRVRVTGATNNNVTWHSTSKIYQLSS